MDKQLKELASKVKALRFRQGKTEEIIAKYDRQASERQRESIANVAKAVNSLKESIEEKKFSKGESEDDVAKWAQEFEEELARADESIRRLTEQIKEVDRREQDDKAVEEHKKNLGFNRELLEQKAAFEKGKANEAESEQCKQSSTAKLPKLPITKFSGKFEAWLPFWGKFTSEIDSTKIPTLTKFAYLKELLDESVRTDIEGLPFTDEGYSKAKEILETEYGKTAEVVNAYIVNINNLPVIADTNPAKVHEFYKQLRYNVQSLETLHKLDDVKGNVRATLDKLKGIKSDLVRGNEGWQEWTFEDLLRELKKWKDINPVEEQSVLRKRSKFLHSKESTNDTKERKCVYCEDTQHKGVNCTKVVKREERKKILAQKKLCFNCAGSQHRAAECKSKMACQKCKKRHHTSICDQSEQLLVAGSNVNMQVTHPVVIVEVEGVKCRALLDTGAGSSYASAALLERISKRKCRKEIRKIDMMLGVTTREVELSTIEIKGTDGKFSMSIEVTKVNKGELLFIDNPRYEKMIQHNPHLEGVQMEDLDRKERLPVHIILGASDYAKLKTDRPPKVGESGQPVAELTRLGWTIMSPGKETINTSNMLLTQTSQVDYEELCRLDVLGLKDTPTNDQSMVFCEFKEQLTRNPSGWYETGLPWRGNHPPLPNNKEASLRRLATLTTKLEREGLTSKYAEIINEQRTEGIIEKADQPSVGREFYIPHKAVVRPDAESTKIRVVYDASSKAHNGIPSLNECLHPGPPLQNKLWDILVRGRFNPVALTGDLQKAFLQIRIRTDDRDALRFHWRKDAQSDLEILRFTRAPFGLVSSPFLLEGVIDAHLNNWEKEEPEVVAKLRKELYVDDLISGSTSVSKVIEVKEKATNIFGDAGFKLHKWHSNERELETTKIQDKDPTYAKQKLGIPEGGDSSMLGLAWNKDRDSLSVTIPTIPTVLTKRGILAKLARICDPLGFASPLTLAGKLIYRAACDNKNAWDAPLTEALAKLWKKWNAELPSLVETQRSLVVHREPIDSIKLHSFGDASGKGVAACVYAVVEQRSGHNQGLVAARSRLPKRGLTIPRLELVAAHMAVNLALNAKKALTGYPVETVHCWSDSSVVLHWITGGGEYKQFVANRIHKINEHQGVVWRHVPTTSNPADLASRGGQVSNSKLWWYGPDWLPNQELWPEDIVPEASVESNAEAKAVKHVFAVAIDQENEIDEVLKKFPLEKAVRVCSWMRRFAHNSLRGRRKGRINGPLTTDETQCQRQFWIKQAQQNCDLEQDRVELNLQPRNDDGVLECRGRIQGEFPVYLPDTHLFTRKVVEEAHRVTLHGGVGLTMAKVRSLYWVPRLRRLVKKVRKSCHGCKRYTATAYATPPPGILPTTRTEGTNPYQVIGVDYAGPLQYRISKKKEGKAYILLYSCSLTRGIYLELLPTLETTDFLGSLKRFIARRGRPERIYSDNGGTFIGAAAWIKAVAKDERLQNFLSINSIRWQFNLSRAPWWGGQFERMIGLVKSALNKTIGKGFLTWKELEEVIVDCEIALNNRPLSYMEDDVQLPVLTPNSMLFVNSNVLPELPPHNIEDGDLRKRAKHLRRCKDAVWKRWTQEYLRNLRERHRAKAGDRGAVPAVGDVVIISTDDRKRGNWPLGIVEELIAGKDGKVRGAKVRTGKSQLERAVQQLYPLELSCDKEEPVPATLSPEAETFRVRPKRDAAVAAELRVEEIVEEEE